MNDNIYTKLKITKDTVEIRNYEHLNVTGRKKGKGVEKTDEEKAYHYGWRQSEKAKKIQNLMQINFENDNAIFVTVTFTQEPETVKDANCILKKFVRLLKKVYNNLIYIAILEKGELGRFHYHVVFNIKYSKIATADIINAWKWGIAVDVKNVYNVRGLGVYITKSFGNEDETMYGKRRFLHAKELQKEIVVKSWDDAKTVDNMKKQLSADNYFSSYNFLHDKCGYVNVTTYMQDLNVYGKYVYAKRKINNHED